MVQDVFQRVVQCIAIATRYPSKLLTANADLESDLGIDSVKRLEIILALEQEFSISLQRDDRDSSVRTISQIARWVEDSLSATRMSHSPAVSSISIPRATAAIAPPLTFPVAARDLPVASHLRIDPPETRTAAPVRNGKTYAAPVVPQPTGRRLDGQVAMVTGSGHGVGRVIACDLAARGATVIVNSFHSRDQGDATVAEIQAAGHEAIHLWGSIANPEHVEDIFRDVERTFGQLDILVCNASDGRLGSFLELTYDDWDRAFRTNVAGHHQCAIRAARLMQPRGGGAIVTLSAVGAHRFIDGLGSQGVAKAAVETMTRYLACELGPLGIRVNCIAGGPVYGELLDKFPEATQSQRHWESITPDGQLCSPMDLANTIAYLVSDEARGINGAVWMVDHGFSANADGRPLRRSLRNAVLAGSGVQAIQ